MKVIDIVIHPLILLTTFFLIIIVGEAFGGFYILYLSGGLGGGHIHSLLGFSGAIILVLSSQGTQSASVLKSSIKIAGALLLAASLFTFFGNDRNHYNWNTFHQILPQMILGLFVLLWIVFFLAHLVQLIRIIGKNNSGSARRIDQPNVSA